MATAEECREAFVKLTGRLSELDPKDRDAFFSGRSFSCHVSDLNVTFVTRFGPNGADPVREAAPGEPLADVRLTAASPLVLELADDVRGLPPGLADRAGQGPRQHARPAKAAQAALSGRRRPCGLA